MKRLLMATTCISAFAISLSIVQMGCSKTEAQSSPNSVTAFNKILYQESFNVGGITSVRYSIVNYDGSGIQHLNIPFPPGFRFSTDGQGSLSPDMKKIFFLGFETAQPTLAIYSCDTSGTNFLRVVACDPTAYAGYVSGAF